MFFIMVEELMGIGVQDIFQNYYEKKVIVVMLFAYYIDIN